MNITILKPSVTSTLVNPKAFNFYRGITDWELVLSVGEGDYIQEYVEFFRFTVKPTKRQIRQTKRKFRKIYLEDSLK